MFRKIGTLWICLMLIMTSVLPAYAANLKLNMRSLGAEYKNHHNCLNGMKFDGGITVFKVNGDYAFCTQAGRGVRDADGNPWDGKTPSLDCKYTLETVTKDNSMQTKIAYLGFLKHKEDDDIWNNQKKRDKYYALTQMMIWHSLPEAERTANGYTDGKPNTYFLNSETKKEYADFKKTIEAKIKNWSVRPSFEGYSKVNKIEAGESISLEDCNNALEDYGSFNYSKDGISVKHVKGSNILQVTADKNCKKDKVIMTQTELRKAGAQKYSSRAKATYLYETDNSQDIAIYGNVGDPIDLALTFEVKLVTGKISIEKKKAPDAYAGSAQPEAGAQFEVYLKSSSSYEDAADDCRDILTTDDDGKTITKALPYGTYTVHQISGSEGHTFVDDFDVTIASDEHDKIYEYVLTNETLKSKLQIIKKDMETDKIIPIAGAGFELINLDTGEKVESSSEDGLFKTDEKGIIEIEKPLYYGDYKLIERIAPTGYILCDKNIEFSVDGKEDTIVIEVRDMAQKGIINIEKTGEVFVTVKNNSDGTYTPVYMNKGLAGAEFEIIAAENITTGDGTVRVEKDTVVDKVITDENGLAMSKELYLGKYNIVETKSPDGYLIDSSIESVELEYQGQNANVVNCWVTKENERQKLDLSLEKYIESNKALGYDADKVYNQIKFALFAEEDVVALDGSLIPKDGIIEVIGVEKQENGNFTGLFKSDLPYGKYYVKEIQQPNGYVKNTDKYSVDFSYNQELGKAVSFKLNNGKPIKNNLEKIEIPVPNTGDNNNFAIWVGAAVISAILVLKLNGSYAKIIIHNRQKI